MTAAGAGSSTGGRRSGARLRALVVDDERPLVQILSTYLEREGFEVLAAFDGEQAVALARAERPDLIVLDLMLPGIDGIEACRHIRGFSDAYIVMLTAKAEEVDKIIGLSTGADDYLTKPFSPGELIARVRAMLRRPRSSDPGRDAVRRFGALELDPGAREVRVDGRPVELTRLEFDLLDALSSEPRLVFSRARLLERVWGGEWFGDDHVVDVHIANLRRKLGDDPAAPRYVRTMRGVGYRMGPG
ncbi:Response regulators consisting of a CheY-like receiver domain and a winged-helix DNA-binding domain [Gaiella occulta]|uniref:Response regulators consisting of a CheY-like receiver domain and a winged-helix DNA-binding domain n=1 Tax=Gaiella occulta TaxID=1002870 RepID=A0A7M2YW64_9ACTN|nr:response regulator transcription factor [Gaiella occulta]RDI73668.1 Response regulators consisting of a CheY-like receiver domain and a winged-helix DNA-binding domain [Gaiella occulta]